MGIFGWSLPPGCNSLPYDEPAYCPVCCMADDCICPECPVCGTCGTPECYLKHGMVRTPEQFAAQAKAERAMKAQADSDAAEAAYWADPQRKVEEAELQRLWRDLERHHARARA